MIQTILIFNTNGKPRLTKFYERKNEAEQSQLIRECFSMISKRPLNMCNFLEIGKQWSSTGGSKIVYRNYATLYFVFIVDSTESELSIMDLIQTFVETLDKCFPNVCELDLVLHMDRVHYILDEMITGGLVLQTSSIEILDCISSMKKVERQENPLGSARSDVSSFLGEFNKG